MLSVFVVNGNEKQKNLSLDILIIECIIMYILFEPWESALYLP